MQLGGQWWCDWGFYARHQYSIENKVLYGDDFPPTVFAAYPSTGGVWAARYNNIHQWRWDTFYNYAKIPKPMLPDVPYGLEAALAWTRSMDEEALVLEKYGATFYSRVKDCPYLPTTVEEGKALFERFEELLEKYPTEHPDLRPRKTAFNRVSEDIYEEDEAYAAFRDENNENEGRLWGFMRSLF
ncbi:hypothetical protein VHEMI03147 [[Torrubiella] hemipterigena]|uniref:Uncharacterized protein n=1 Tax=[Torrubiella] hemipterigena TaxID=1531966 RepID=A0A0A1SXS1_9HYPO|nr:hypothetical protein VHEMI03147 [[Torrubiella] hemipterigena]